MRITSKSCTNSLIQKSHKILKTITKSVAALKNVSRSEFACLESKISDLLRTFTILESILDADATDDNNV